MIKNSEYKKLSAGITKIEAQLLLEQDIRTAKSALDRLCRVDISDNQEAALISFIFNLGCRAQASSLRQKIK